MDMSEDEIKELANRFAKSLTRKKDDMEFFKNLLMTDFEKNGLNLKAFVQGIAGYAFEIGYLARHEIKEAKAITAEE